MKDFLRALDEISPYIRRAWDGHMIAGWELKERVIFDYEMVYIMEGKAEITIEDRLYNAEPGEVYLFRPRIRHSMYVPLHSILRQPHIHFDFYKQKDSESLKVSYRPMQLIQPNEMKYFREDHENRGFPELPERIRLNNKMPVEKLFFEIIRDQEKPDSYSFLRSKACFIQLLVCLLTEIYGEEIPFKVLPPLSYEKINAIGEYLRINYRLNLNIERLSRMAGMSQSHFLRLFKRVYSTSPMQYQLNLKIERAKQMISAFQNTVTEVSQYLGFSDVQHFSKVFKKKTGVSPSAFREVGQ